MRVTVVMSIVLLIVLPGCGGEAGAPASESATETEMAAGTDQTPAGTASDPFVGRGVIEEIRDSELVIRHEAIPGFMMAMTMAYPLSADVDVSTLEPGDEVLFDIERLEPEGQRVIGVRTVD